VQDTNYPLFLISPVHKESQKENKKGGNSGG